MSLLERLHQRIICEHRVQAMASALASLLPKNSRCLDVGSGDGRIDQRLLALRPDLAVTSVETHVRPDAVVPIQAYDGNTLPFPDAAFDGVLLIDVLHHSEDAGQLLRDARRVSRDYVVVKDHVIAGAFDRLTLLAMDWLANRRYGYPMRYRYLPQSAWDAHFEETAIEVVSWATDLHLYPWPFTVCCDRSLQFLALLRKR